MELLQTETCRKLQNNNEEKAMDMCPSIPYKETSLELDISDFQLDINKKACLEQSDHKFDNILPPRLPPNFRGTGLMSWRHSIEPPTSIGHLTFLLDCFVISFGPDMPQLGRYHPQSDPERYAVKSEDEWSLLSEDEFPSTLPWTNLLSERQVGTSVGFHRFALSDNQRRENGGQGVTGGRRPERNFAPFQDTASVIRLEDADFATGFTFPDEIIIRELSEMRVLLERLLENRDLVEWNTHNGLRDILALLPDGNLSAKEPSPHFPVGEWEFEECGICFEVQWLYRRPCCSFAACTSCLQQYYSFKVDQGLVKIECCNPACSSFVHRDEISARLEPAMKEKFHKLLILANEDASTKTCPRCNHVTKVSRKSQKRSEQPKTPCVECPACHLEWCFACHAPWHGHLTCKQFRKGDRLLRTWAKEKNHGQLNAQKCPKCKIYIQRTTGCDHMHCTRCKADFCYRCGDRFRRLKFFGDHYSKLSVFGCKYRYKADRPLQRKFIRGAIFGGKIVAAPILGALALCAGALAVGVSVFALPFYGGVRLYRHCERRQQPDDAQSLPTRITRARAYEPYNPFRDH